MAIPHWICGSIFLVQKFILLAILLGIILACSTAKPYQPPSALPGMVLISGGTFIMGCTAGDLDCEKDELPSHMVTLKSYYMDESAVVLEAYKKCIDAEHCPPSLNYAEDTKNWQYEHEDYPMTDVNWSEARNYCEWVGKRLPSEAEWEYAARAGHNKWKYLWGNEVNGSEARYMGLPDGPISVTRHQANAYGLRGMIGNVQEWVEDCWHESYKGAPMDGTAWITNSCSTRVKRGSDFDNIAEFMRVSFRFEEKPDTRNLFLGFRCAKSVE
jgi:serine/threonine-protein kinase